jgi:large subunit ribosomal protein L4
MLEAQLYTTAAKGKGSYALPEEFDGAVNETVLYHAVRAYLANQRQGTHSTKTRAEVSGGTHKPWRQKGTGRARQGTTRAAQWRGGGIVFGPKPRSYRTDLPRKVKRLARQSALNARANDGALLVIEGFAFAEPKTRELVALLAKLGVGDRKVLILTHEIQSALYRSGRNLPNVHVMRYEDASPYDVLWSDAVVVEKSAIGGQAVSTKGTRGRAARAKRAAEGTTQTRKTTAKRAKAKATKSAASQKGGKDA